MNEEKLFTIIKNITGKNDISVEGELVCDLGLSSFQIMLLLSEIEEETHANIPIDKISNTTKVSDLYSLIERAEKQDD